MIVGLPQRPGQRRRNFKSKKKIIVRVGTITNFLDKDFLKKIAYLNYKKYAYLNYGRQIIFNWVGDYIKNNDKNKMEKINVLDIGCGWGADLTNLKEISRNLELYGIEIDERKVVECQQKNIIIFKINCEQDKIPVDDNFFDVIILNQVLEHMKEIFFIFSEISRVLKKGGIVIIGVPNLASWHNRILLLFGYQPTCIKVLGPHVRGFTAPSLKDFISIDNLFIVKDIKGANFYPAYPPISKIMSELFPQLSVSIFLLIERTSKKGSFINILEKENFETNLFSGEKIV